MLMKAMADVRTNLGKDPVWRVHYDEKANYAHMEEGKVKLFMNYICSGTLNKEILSMSLNDLMVMMMGHDTLKRCFWKEHDIIKFSKLLENWHKVNESNGSDLEPVTTSFRILDSAMVVISDNPNLSDGGDIKYMCSVVFEVVKSKKWCSEICTSSVHSVAFQGGNINESGKAYC